MTGFDSGRVTSIYVAPTAAQPMQARSQVWAEPGRGLEGDRYFARTDNGSSRVRSGREPAEVTLIEAEVIDHLRRDLGVDVEAPDTRRNIVTRGMPLNALVGSEFSVGEVRLLGTSLCERASPSSRRRRTNPSCVSSYTGVGCVRGFLPRAQSPSATPSSTRRHDPLIDQVRDRRISFRLVPSRSGLREWAEPSPQSGEESDRRLTEEIADPLQDTGLETVVRERSPLLTLEQSGFHELL